MAKKTMDDVDLLLSILDREQLDRFIRKECANNSQFQDRFLALGVGSIFKPVPDFYSTRIEELIEDYGGRYGYVEYGDAFGFNCAVSKIVEEADEAIRNLQWEVAVVALTGISNTCEDIINCGDDSDGYLGAVVSDCFEVWHKLCKEELPEYIKMEIFNLAIARFEAKDLKGWDWWWDWIDIAISVADIPEQQSRVINALGSIQTDSDDWNACYNIEKAQYYRLKMMAKCGTPEQQKEFMYKNVTNPEFREKLMQMAWDEENYEEVLRLAEDGERYDMERERLVLDWCKWKMKVYRQRNDKENTLKLARYFFFNRNFGKGQEYSMEAMYLLMKSLLPDRQWGEWVESLLVDAVEKKDICELYIYTQEKTWDKYIAYLRRKPIISFLDDAPNEVKTLYRNEFIHLYEQQVRDFFQTANNRDSYRYGAGLLRRLIDYGGGNEAQAIITEQKARIPRRSALIDELSKI